MINKNLGTRFWRVTLIATLAAFSPGAWSAEAGAELFESANPIRLTLKLPWQAIVTDEFFFQGPFPAEIQWKDENEQNASTQLEVWRRGNSRQVLCRFPPIKLTFDKETTGGTPFEGQKSLKLVTPCNEGIEYEQYVVLEELGYRIYNQLTELSFRVQPLSLTFVDSDTDKTTGPVAVFLVEDDGDVAKRNGQKKFKSAEFGPEQLDSAEATRLSLFEYLIGNTHWSLRTSPGDDKCCDNVDLMGQEPDFPAIHAVPNDFDGSGLVNAPYAVPQEGLPVTSVTQRLHQGYCAHGEALQSARDLFLGKESDIRSLIEGNSRLTPESRAGALAFVGGFFDVLRDDTRFSEEVEKTCRQ